MGNVLRALKKSRRQAGSPESQAVHVISLAVANAQRAAQDRLDETQAPPQAGEPAEVLEVAAPGRPLPAEPGMQTDQPPPESSDSSAKATWQDVLSATALPDEHSPEATAPLPDQSPTNPTIASPLLLARNKPRCAVSEQVRQVRTSLLGLAGASLIRCMITSAQAGEGKSVTSANLAYSFSEIARKRTLLIDGDLRRGRLAELLGLPDHPGLAEFLAGQCHLPEVIQPTDRANLFAVAAGRTGRESAGQLITGEQTHRKFEELAQGFDYVIVDCPPVAGLADACVIGQWANAALLAVRMHRTPRQAVREAVERLKLAGVELAGLIALSDQDSANRHYYDGYDS